MGDLREGSSGKDKYAVVDIRAEWQGAMLEWTDLCKGGH